MANNPEFVNEQLEKTGDARVYSHPGFGKAKARKTPKGRPVEEQALQEIKTLIGDTLPTKDLMIEFLHLIQDKYGHVSAQHIRALAHVMKLSQAEINETATFYAHFDVVKENEPAPADLTIRVCESLSCQLMGAESLKLAIDNGVDANKVRVINAPCMGRCHVAPVVEVGHNHIVKATAEKVVEAVKNDDTHPIVPEYQGFDDYVAEGGYERLKELLDNKFTPDEIIEKVSNTGLRGLGGAGFPTGRKWSFVRAEAGPRLMAVNGDEGEPGTIKDHHYLARRPQQFLEGMLIGAWVVEATDVYIYLRDEYPEIRKVLQAEIKKVQDAGLSPHTNIHLRRGAGAYICGEESAMLESIEGKRGWPRQRPPFVAQKGLWGRPTLVNNVESLYWIPELLTKDESWFKSHGTNGREGLRSYSVSGRVKNPGVHFAPAGTTIQELIDNYAGGMEDGHTFKAYLPGGASGGILPATMNDIPLDFDTLNQYGCFIGSAAVVVLSDADNMRDVATNLMEFFEDESCGQCTPCRVGTQKILSLIKQDEWDIDLLKEISGVMMDASICGLGQAAPNPLLRVIEHFPEDLKKQG
ncbi:MAG: NADH-ubiquinone oxidoreductase-F iron-sulfur binding region domain-containing protein [Alphaproteobacteria bacterium]